MQNSTCGHSIQVKFLRYDRQMLVSTSSPFEIAILEFFSDGQWIVRIGQEMHKKQSYVRCNFGVIMQRIFPINKLSLRQFDDGQCYHYHKFMTNHLILKLCCK